MVIRNALIPEGENRLQAVHIHCDERILKLEPLTEKPIEWRGISTQEKHQRLIRELPRMEPGSPTEVDAQFLLVIPGTIDPHVHFDTPGFEFREDFDHASEAAARGGVTTIIDMPCTSIPPVTNVKNMETKLEAVKGRSRVDYAFWGGISGSDFSDESTLERNVRELAEAGVAGFKTYLISGMELFTDLTPYQMWRAARWIAETGLPMGVHAEEKSLVLSRQEALMNSGQNDWRAYCQSRDVLAESSAVALLVEIARSTGVRLHVVHLSSKRGLDLIKQAQQSGISITTETCPHYLLFTQRDFDNPAISNYLKTAPPVKHAEDREALWQGLQDGSIAFVTTDHAGCQPEQEKSSKNFWEVYGGIPGVEHRVPFLISEGFLKGRLTLQQTVELLSTNPARFFGLGSRKGKLQVGYDADLVLMNPFVQETVRAETMHSKGKYTPFEGVVFRARVEKTWLRGRLIVSHEPHPALEKKKTGQFIRVKSN